MLFNASVSFLSLRRLALGYLFANIKLGYGELFLKSGAKYKGDFLNGLFHGVGTYTYKNGQTYQGEWKNDKREGMGKITWPSGASSYGPFKNDKRHGTHDYTYDSGEKEKILYDKGNKV